MSSKTARPAKDFESCETVSLAESAQCPIVRWQAQLVSCNQASLYARIETFMICLPAGRREEGAHMSAAGTGHKPENLAVGAVLTTLSFFCVAVVGALGKAAGQLTSTAVVVLFQNLICSWSSFRRQSAAARHRCEPTRSACMSCVPQPEPPAGTRCL